MKFAQRKWGTIEELGIASIIEVASHGAWNIEQDIKGRWHVWSTPATEPDHSDPIARQLEADLV
jgi:hypothetical protein